MALDLRCRHDESLRLEAARLHDAGLGRAWRAPRGREKMAGEVQGRRDGAATQDGRETGVFDSLRLAGSGAVIFRE